MERYMDVSTNATSMDKGLIEYDEIVLTIFFVQVRSEKLTCMFLDLINIFDGDPQSARFEWNYHFF